MNPNDNSDCNPVVILKVIGKLIDKAIEKASHNEFLHEEALAYELAGLFYLNKNKF